MDKKIINKFFKSIDDINKTIDLLRKDRNNLITDFVYKTKMTYVDFDIAYRKWEKNKKYIY